MKTQKTQKSFRKKALLSSVSMLLVSTVAVGSATFAWFTSNKSVTADTMQVKASAAQGLQITNDYGKSWASAVSYTTLATAAQTIAPVSLAYSNGSKLTTLGTPYYPANAEVDGPLYLTDVNASVTNPDNSDKITGFTTAHFPNIPTSNFTGEAVAKSDNFIAYKVGIKSTGAAITKTITGYVNYTSKTNSEYVRIAVLENAASTFTTDSDGNTTYSVGDTTWDRDDVKIVYGSETSPYAYTGSTLEAQTAPVAAGSSSKFTVGTLDEKQTKWYTVLVWFEGQDTQCVDANQSLAYDDIEINFSYT